MNIEDIDWDRDEGGKAGEDGSGPFKSVLLSDMFIDCEGSSQWCRDGNGLYSLCLHGVEYMAATPARKSLANALPPVADAE